MDALDLTPDLRLLTAEQEIVLPSPVNADSTNQPIGGFMASPGALTNGNITFDGANEQVRIGSATAPNAGVGIFMGNAGDGTYDFRVGDPSGSYIWWDASTNTLTVVGGVSVSHLDIPDTTTAHSFHTDASGNSWWGANVATGLAGANASIDNTGAAVFRSIQMGGATHLYVVNDNGIYSFGDGSDGSATIAADTTLSSDKYYTDLTINSGKTLFTNGYRVFCTGTLTINGTIDRSGNAGANGTANAITPGNGGAALADGYLKGSVAGGTGGAGLGATTASNGNNGVTGTAVSNSLGPNGQAGGAGGSEAARTGGTSTGGTATASNVKLIANWHLATLLDVSSSGATVKFTSGAGGGGGGGGAANGGNGTPTTGGGGAGSGGGVIAIYARNIVIGASGLIKAQGGAGGNGGNQATNNVSSGGGGAGGAGGIIVLVYNTLTNAGTTSVAGGAAGLGGTITASNQAYKGADGTAGNTGVIYQFQISL